MAQRVHISLEDDIDGSEATETVRFGLDGTAFEIDLSSANATQFRDVLAPYVGSARRVSRRAAKGSRARLAGGPSPSEVREWARMNGHEVSERGRVSGEIRAAYDAAH